MQQIPDDVIAMGPVIESVTTEDQHTTRRLVIRDLPKCSEFVVHNMIQDHARKSKPVYYWGHYFPYRTTPKKLALVEAWRCFSTKMEEYIATYSIQIVEEEDYED
jgi:hypothetical protein